VGVRAEAAPTSPYLRIGPTPFFGVGPFLFLRGTIDQLAGVLNQTGAALN